MTKAKEPDNNIVGRYSRRELFLHTSKACLATTFLSVLNGLPGAGLTQALFDAKDWHLRQSRRVTSSPTLLQLEQDVAAEIAAYPGEVALAVTDLQTGESFAIAGDRPQVGACTINLFLLYSVVADLERRSYPIWEVDWIVNAAVGASDPKWAKVLVEKTGSGSIALGVAKINQLMQDMGAVDSLYDHSPGYIGLYSLSGQDNYVSANDLNIALSKLYHGELFGPEFTAYALGKLLNVRPQLNNMLPAMLPTNRVRVAHKVGFINHSGYSVRNDAGIVFVKKGEQEIAYAISFLSQQNENYWAGASFGARLSRIVFDHFDTKY